MLHTECRRKTEVDIHVCSVGKVYLKIWCRENGKKMWRFSEHLLWEQAWHGHGTIS